MNYKEVYEAYNNLKEILVKKHDAIIKKNLEELNSLDEATIILVDKIKKIDIENTSKSFSEEEKNALKSLGEEIKKIEKNNEILIKHSLDVINNILSGILNIVQSDKNSYNSKGIGCVDNESLNISSITEEA